MDLFSNLENTKSPKTPLGDKGNIISVSEYLDKLNFTLKSEKAKILGEVSGLQEYPGRSYLYFSIKDKTDSSTVKCFMWKNDYKLSGVALVDGVEIIVTAYPNIYKPNGGMTLQVELVEMVGAGALQIAYEKLKAKLLAEGLFDESKKRAIPEFPHRIGVITSKSGAVINDFLSNIGKYGFEILFVDSKVEGADAVKDLLAAVKTLANKKGAEKVDVLVMMRGGGSLESFQAFNNETLARAVAAFPAPVITGIGHDKDAPLISMISDKNVSTPTAVANLLSLGWREASFKLKNSEQNILSVYDNTLRQKLFFLEQSERIMEKSFNVIFEKFKVYLHALKRAEDKIQSAITVTRGTLVTVGKQLINSAENMVQTMYSDLDNFAHVLEARNPERQLQLGWSIVKNKEGSVIRRVEDVKVGEDFQISLSDGTMDAKRN
jgi:exodeoxyribonuclease VII large subunit